MNRPFPALYEEAGGGGGGGTATTSTASTGGTVQQGGASGGTTQTTQTGDGKSGVQTPWFSSWLKADGTLDHSAIDKAPDGVKALKDTLGVFTKFEDLVDSYGHQRKLLSGKGLMPLRADATDAEKTAHRATLRKVLGVPDSPEAYGIDKALAVIPEEFRDPEFTKAITKVMHDLDFSPAQAQGIAKAYAEYSKSVLDAGEAEETKNAQAELQRANALLDKEWGLNRPRMEQLAVRGALTGGLDPNSDLFKQPEVRIMCARFARMVGEDKLVTSPDGKGTIGTAKQQLDALMNDKSHRLNEALWNPGHPLHETAKTEWDRLTKALGEEQDAARR